MDDLDDMDHRIVSALRARGTDPRVAGAARALSWAGEHGALWLAAGLAAAAVDAPRRTAWLRGTALTAGAHVVSMGAKRVVRRPRPAHVVPLVRTAGRHSFPSSHATSAAAAAVVFGSLGVRAAWPLAAAVCASRLVVGVHYPSDVAAGAAWARSRPGSAPTGCAEAPVTDTAVTDTAVLRQRGPEQQREPDPPRRARRVLAGLLRTARPRQWVKNVLVVAAPAAAGELFSAHALGRLALVFVLFTACAAAVYLVNDARDADADRAHPVKRHRPVAAGDVPVPLAYAVGGVLGVLAPVLAAWLCPAPVAALLTAYLAMQLAYCVSLKHVLVVDLAVVTTGFLMRAMIGGLALGIPLSRWFLITTGFGALFMVAAKRYSKPSRWPGRTAPRARCSPSTPPATCASSGSSPPGSPSSATACGPWRRAAYRTPASCPGASSP